MSGVRGGDTLEEDEWTGMTSISNRGGFLIGEAASVSRVTSRHNGMRSRGETTESPESTW